MKFSRTVLLTLVFCVMAGISLSPAGFAAGCDGKNQASQFLIQKNMPGQIVVGKPYSYTISVTNKSACPIGDVSVVETLPKAYEMNSASPEASKVTGQVAQWDFGSLKAGETKEITINGKAKSVGSFESCTKAFHSQTLCLAPELGIPAVLLEVVDTEDPVQVGGTEKFYITVTNQGNATDENIVVKVNFEENFDYVSSAGPTRAKSTSEKSVEFSPLASLAPGQKATWEVVAKAISEGDHRTSIKLTSDTLERSVDETESTHVY